MTTIEESGLAFSFPDGTRAVKFDGTAFYAEKYRSLPGCKGIDILADSPAAVQLIEIKNCTGDERNNLWRIAPNNKRNTIHTDRDSLDIELARKVASTLSCLYGAWTKSETTEKSTEYEPFFSALTAKDLLTNEKKLLVILVMEGDFGSATRSKKTIMRELQNSMNGKLCKWLHCRVSVVDSHTYNETYFHMERMPPKLFD